MWTVYTLAINKWIVKGHPHDALDPGPVVPGRDTRSDGVDQSAGGDDRRAGCSR
jgi:hypothetical protein